MILRAETSYDLVCSIEPPKALVTGQPVYQTLPKWIIETQTGQAWRVASSWRDERQIVARAHLPHSEMWRTFTFPLPEEER